MPEARKHTAHKSVTRKKITRATELTAISVSRLIREKGFTSDDLLTEEESEAREELIDQAGVDAMRAALTDIPFVLRVVGSEGRKHIHQYGEALPTLEGTFGPAGAGLKLDMVNDVVEGSKAAKLNSPGAVSVIAVGSHKGLMPTPADIDYMDKLFGPPELFGRISINKPIEENLAEVIDMFRIKPSEINLVVLARARNAHYINAAEKFGANLIIDTDSHRPDNILETAELMNVARDAGLSDKEIDELYIKVTDFLIKKGVK